MPVEDPHVAYQGDLGVVRRTELAGVGQDHETTLKDGTTRADMGDGADRLRTGEAKSSC